MPPAVPSQVSFAKTGKHHDAGQAEWFAAQPAKNTGHHEDCGIAGSIRSAPRCQVSAPCFRRTTLGPMMLSLDVTEASRLKTEHHRMRLIDSVPAEARLQSAYRLKAPRRVHLDGTARMELGYTDFAPTAAVRLVKSRSRYAQNRIAREFTEQQFDEVGGETQIGVEPQNVVVLVPRFARQALHYHRFASCLTWTLSFKVLHFQPRVMGNPFVKDCGRGVGPTVGQYDPPRRQVRFRRH